LRSRLRLSQHPGESLDLASFLYCHFSLQGSEEVRAQHILHAVVQPQREGLQRVMEHLESVEGELASYITKQLSMIHQKLTDLGAPVRRSHLLLCRIDALALVCNSALRESRYLADAGEA
jgi:hypothetical protein